MLKLTLADIDDLDLREVRLLIRATEEICANYEQALADHRENLKNLTYRRNKLERLEQEAKA